MARVIDDGPDQSDGSHGTRSSDEIFQDSLARLSLHLATRQLPARLPPPPARSRWNGWPYAVLILGTAAGAAAYQYAAFDGDLLGRANALVAEAAPAAAPLPVLAAVAVAPAPAPAPPPIAEPARPASVEQVAAMLPMPAPAEPFAAPPDLVSANNNPMLVWAEVLELQRRLMSLGISPGPLDGIVGPRTAAAVQRYQELKGLTPSGLVDRPILTRLQQDPNSSPILEARVK